MSLFSMMSVRHAILPAVLVATVAATGAMAQEYYPRGHHQRRELRDRLRANVAFTRYHGHCYAADAAGWNAAAFCSGVR